MLLDTICINWIIGITGITGITVVTRTLQVSANYGLFVNTGFNITPDIEESNDAHHPLAAFGEIGSVLEIATAEQGVFTKS